MLQMLCCQCSDFKDDSSAINSSSRLIFWKISNKICFSGKTIANEIFANYIALMYLTMIINIYFTLFFTGYYISTAEYQLW